ncbi:Protein kinase domain [Dillenia turbinata]|uniref:Protein kinase domain n=1 Tax=Dillenia turbinata TaxID=194707 RepID=A0AAN8V853_9MAGN
MNWFQNTFSSLSKASSSPSSDEFSKKKSFGYKSLRRLTRQRKLRHLSDRDIGIRSGSASPEKYLPQVSRSSSWLDHSSARSPSAQSSSASPHAVPQPLPVPELAAVLRRDGVQTNPNSADFRLPSPSPSPSPKDGFCSKVVDDAEGFDLNMSCSLASKSATQDGQRGTERLKSRRSVISDAQDDFKLNVPTRSAPVSPSASPLRSPQRKSKEDIFLPRGTFPIGLQVWSAPEMPASDMVIRFQLQASPENSPRQRSPGINPRSMSGPPSPLRTRRSFEATTPCRESNGNAVVHPLPLPPGAAMSMQSAPSPQVVAKTEILPMKNQWQKGKLIGRGTFGSVYVGTNRPLRKEIKVLSQLKHPNIVQYYGSEIVDDKFYIYLEYVYPGSISKYLREHSGAVTESVVRNFSRHILSGLAYLHSMKTIHRDIKGANLLVDSSGVVKLADFGMAKHLTGQKYDLSMKGSPYWMAPELLQAVMQRDINSDLAFAIDIWSLGCTIIEMLNGKPPWSEYEGAAALFKVLRESPPIPDTLSPEGKDFLRCCFRRNPAERPTAGKLLEHRFIKNSFQMELSSSRVFNGTKLQDNALSPRDYPPFKLDLLSTLSGAAVPHGKSVTNGETGQRSHPETSNLIMATRHSPRSTLETLPSLSPPRSGQSTNHTSPPPNIPLATKEMGSRRFAFSDSIWRGQP